MMTRPDGLKICDAHLRPTIDEEGNVTEWHGDVVDDGVEQMPELITEPEDIHFCNSKCKEEFYK